MWSRLASSLLPISYPLSSLPLFLQCFSFYVPFTDYLSFFLDAAASPSVLMELIIISAPLPFPPSKLLPSNKEKPCLELWFYLIGFGSDGERTVYFLTPVFMSSINISSYTCSKYKRQHTRESCQSIFFLIHFMLRTKLVVKHLSFRFLFAVWEERMKCLLPSLRS